MQSPPKMAPERNFRHTGREEILQHLSHFEALLPYGSFWKMRDKETDSRTESITLYVVLYREKCKGRSVPLPKTHN